MMGYSWTIHIWFILYTYTKTDQYLFKHNDLHLSNGCFDMTRKTQLRSFRRSLTPFSKCDHNKPTPHSSLTHPQQLRKLSNCPPPDMYALFPQQHSFFFLHFTTKLSSFKQRRANSDNTQSHHDDVSKPQPNHQDPLQERRDTKGSDDWQGGQNITATLRD